MAHAFVAIGSNIEPAKNVRAAVLKLAERTTVTDISMVYCTEALRHPEQPHYFNCVVKIDTETPPGKVKHGILRPIEDRLGRKRSDDKYAPRTIDLDLILYDDLAIDDGDIRLPDPDILERAFLAAAVFELAPDLVLPGYGLRINDIAAKLSREGMKPLEDYARELRKETIYNRARN